jgi:hypothetical protein
VETEVRREKRRLWRRGRDTTAGLPLLGRVVGLGFRVVRRERKSVFAAATARVWDVASEETTGFTRARWFGTVLVVGF